MGWRLGNPRPTSVLGLVVRVRVKVKVKSFNESLLFVNSLLILRLAHDVGIEVEHGDAEILAEILQRIAAARGTAGMKQKGRSTVSYPFVLDILYQSVKLFLEVAFVHCCSVFDRG